MTIKPGMKIIVTNSNYCTTVPNGTIMTVVPDEGDGNVCATVDGGDRFAWFMESGTYEPYDTPAADTPVLWRDMTPAEKGALLLAHHEGKVIEWNATSLRTGEWTEWTVCPSDCLWDDKMGGDGFAYRVKPEPVVETVTQFWERERNNSHCIERQGDTHRITFNMIDGKPDVASIKMEAM